MGGVQIPSCTRISTYSISLPFAGRTCRAEVGRLRTNRLFPDGDFAVRVPATTKVKHMKDNMQAGRGRQPGSEYKWSSILNRFNRCKKRDRFVFPGPSARVGRVTRMYQELTFKEVGHAKDGACRLRKQICPLLHVPAIV